MKFLSDFVFLSTLCFSSCYLEMKEEGSAWGVNKPLKS